MLTREIIILDFETNGFNATSVLSLSAIKAQVTIDGLVEIDRFNRFYFRTPGETINAGAIEINGLTEAQILHYRGDSKYPEHYIDDIDSFIEFCGDADHFVAHNFSFDKDFVGFETLISFCTFIEAQKINIGKNNKLSDFAKFYNIEIIEENLHNSMYDVEVLFDILNAMYKVKNPNFMEFLNERPLNKKEQKYIQTRFNSYLLNKRELRDRALKNRKDDSKHFFNISSSIEKIQLPKHDITVFQFLNIANKSLTTFGLESVSSGNFNNYLKSLNILSGDKKNIFTNENSKNYGAYTEQRVSEETGEYEVILWNSQGKKNLIKYLIEMINEN